MSRILVTGGTGFIGSALVRALVMRGDRVRTLDNDWRGSSASLFDIKNQIEIVTGDIRHLEVVNKAFRDIEIVLHLAAINGTENFYKSPELVLEVGVKGMMNVLDAARSNGVEHLFVMSSSEVYQTPPVCPTDETAPLVIPDVLNARYSYGSSKIISEMLSLHSKGDWRTVIVRPHNVYGPRMGYEHVIPQFVERMMLLKGNAFPIQGTGEETRSFCYIDDFVEGFLTVMKHGENRNIYHIGSDEETSIADLARKVGRYFGREIEVVPSPLTKGSTPKRAPNIEKIRKLGFSPKTKLDVGLKTTVAWYENDLVLKKGRNHEISKA